MFHDIQLTFTDKTITVALDPDLRPDELDGYSLRIIGKTGKDLYGIVVNIEPELIDPWCLELKHFDDNADKTRGYAYMLMIAMFLDTYSFAFPSTILTDSPGGILNIDITAKNIKYFDEVNLRLTLGPGSTPSEFYENFVYNNFPDSIAIADRTLILLAHRYDNLIKRGEDARDPMEYTDMLIALQVDGPDARVAFNELNHQKFIWYANETYLKIEDRGYDHIKRKSNSKPLSSKTKQNTVNDEITYVDQAMIEAFRLKQDTFNYGRLLTLLDELNKSYNDQRAHACALLIRSICNHVPPLLGYRTFDQVVSNHSWGRTPQEYMGQLKALVHSRPVSDDAAHVAISGRDDQVRMIDIPSGKALSALLHECLESKIDGPVRSDVRPPKKHEEPKKETKLKSSIEGGKIRWANNYYHFGGGFEIPLVIDNFEGNRDYVTNITVAARNLAGDTWQSKSFGFDGIGRDREAEIDKGKVVRLRAYALAEKTETPTVWPDLDKNTLTVRIEYRTGDVEIITLNPDMVE